MLTEDEIIEAYDDGMEAAQRGGKAAECPHPYDSEKGDRWMLGFQDGGGDD